jgi:hypothetical protein
MVIHMVITKLLEGITELPGGPIASRPFSPRNGRGFESTSHTKLSVPGSRYADTSQTLDPSHIVKQQRSEKLEAREEHISSRRTHLLT